ncbi:MAG: hypothetical protein GYA17_11415 [Chloroflexi bacterium]|nr:hypothetical protein [Chloroflexota bacterium]
MALMRGFPLIHTKIMIPPVRSGLVERTRLVQQINTGLSCGFVLLSAPPGYGKTTLLSAWAAQADCPLAWLSLDKHDNDLVNFTRYLALAVHSALPGLEQRWSELHDLPQEHTPAEMLTSFLTVWMNALQDEGQKLALVLDEYHTIQNPEIHAALDFLLEYLPPCLYLVLSSRSDPPLALPRLRALNRVRELGAADLRFSRQEIVEFFTHTMGHSIDDNEASLLEQRTEGWVTGLQLAALSLRQSQPTPSLASVVTGENRFVLGYLLEEILHQQPPEVQTFLLNTSILEGLTGALCEAVAFPGQREGRGRELLRLLARANMFILPLDQKQQWFRYHPLFAEALRHLLEEKHPEEIPGLHERASRWYESNGYPDEALKHAMAAGNYRQVVEILEKTMLQVIKTGEITPLQGWVQKLPEDMLRTSPLLCVAYAWILIIAFETDSAGYWLDEATRGLSPESEPQIQGEILAIRSMLAAANGQGDEALELSNKAIEHLPPESFFTRSHVMLEQGLYYLLNGNLHQAQESFQESIRLSQPAGIWSLNILARSYLGETLGNLGQLSQAIALLQQSIQLAANPQWKDLGLVGDLYIEMGELLLERNQLDEAMACFRQGIEVSNSWLPELIEMDGRLHQVRIKQYLGDFKGAAADLRRAHQIADSNQASLDNLALDVFEARLALLRGDLHDALAWAQKNGYLEPREPLYRSTVPLSIQNMISLNVARIWLLLGRQEKQPAHFQRALPLLTQLMQSAEQSGAVLNQIEALVLLAQVRQEEGDQNAALDYLQRALALAEPEKFYRVLLDEGLPLARLISRLLARRKRAAQANQLPTRAFLSEVLFLFSPGPGASGAGAGGEAAGPGEAEELPPIELLTSREREILELVARGCSNNEIALQLSLALNTVKRHLNNIFLKLGATTRTQAVAIARQHGWIH